MDATKLGEDMWTIHLEHMRVLDEIVERSRTRGESGVLLYLYHVGRPMYPGELTDKLGLTTGRIANILKVLEHSGLIVRTPDAMDKRRVRVALTPAGEDQARRQNENAIAFHSRLLSKLEPDEAECYMRVMKRLADIFDREGAGVGQ
ncbi:MAG: winged helix-turn-helix transcriptional regulator [Clostridia bacterium]|nr:winged helix-turn-helix transcriptional regulator [Clostridia bacterium]